MKSPCPFRIHINVRKGKLAKGGGHYSFIHEVFVSCDKSVILNTMLDTETERNQMSYQNFKKIIV